MVCHRFPTCRRCGRLPTWRPIRMRLCWSRRSCATSAVESAGAGCRNPVALVIARLARCPLPRPREPSGAPYFGFSETARGRAQTGVRQRHGARAHQIDAAIRADAHSAASLPPASRQQECRLRDTCSVTRRNDGDRGRHDAPAMSNATRTQHVRRIRVLAMLWWASVDGGSADLRRTADALGAVCVVASAGWLLLAGPRGVLPRGPRSLRSR